MTTPESGIETLSDEQIEGIVKTIEFKIRNSLQKGTGLSLIISLGEEAFELVEDPDGIKDLQTILNAVREALKLVFQTSKPTISIKESEIKFFVKESRKTSKQSEQKPPSPDATPRTRSALTSFFRQASFPAGVMQLPSEPAFKKPYGDTAYIACNVNHGAKSFLVVTPKRVELPGKYTYHTSPIKRFSRATSITLGPTLREPTFRTLYSESKGYLILVPGERLSEINTEDYADEIDFLERALP
jgi:hypothetical protein